MPSVAIILLAIFIGLVDKPYPYPLAIASEMTWMRTLIVSIGWITVVAVHPEIPPNANYLRISLICFSFVV